ncbi:hypothetical protein NDU88_000936 [Pleurodeles waltl]|uniref:C2H2-type domain-containing protein n=1 Tax=Pleurodeles waltl TaxID=8319 RepID=A0AAV7S7E7_PLEWA|nr:hypothetical protein NDU88_000936 [Pleurodeles waltl]
MLRGGRTLHSRNGERVAAYGRPRRPGLLVTGTVAARPRQFVPLRLVRGYLSHTRIPEPRCHYGRCWQPVERHLTSHIDEHTSGAAAVLTPSCTGRGTRDSRCEQSSLTGEAKATRASKTLLKSSFTRRRGRAQEAARTMWRYITGN